ncbi:hypothetical protein BJ508DRAFT_175918 [Ascobolus immersus RN42]|uniref:Uncharacterized protein n=1 Tax=Ascobolus immersus RN42 TaxID=1160509 RepID=A0A3N4HX02_ASCIM|nr:hypothetical protein BJ508DRAFT_175918 [Ascobolus immersus RN42]
MHTVGKLVMMGHENTQQCKYRCGRGAGMGIRYSLWLCSWEGTVTPFSAEKSLRPCFPGSNASRASSNAVLPVFASVINVLGIRYPLASCSRGSKQASGEDRAFRIPLLSFCHVGAWMTWYDGMATLLVDDSTVHVCGRGMCFEGFYSPLHPPRH